VWEPYARAVEALGRPRHRSRWLNAVSVELAPEGLDRARRLPFVTDVRPVAVARAASLGPAFDARGRPLETTLASWQGRAPGPGRRDPALNYGPALGQLSEIGVPALHELGFTANRVRLMMLDTGFRKDHAAFAHTRPLGEWDFVFEDGDVQNEPEDSPYQHNHGTGCWGTAGGYAPGNLIGPAFGATFVLAKTEDTRSETRAEEDNYVAALEWADTLGVAITSASLTYLGFDDGFRYGFEDKDGDTAVITRAVDIAAARGILCFNSQGNYGCEVGSLGTPADADSVVAAGAVDSLNVIAWFSACGPTYDGRHKPEVVARGVRTVWADANGPDSYGVASGTSLSAPLVSGAAALLMEAHPEWSAMETRQALMESADRAGAPDDQYGWGRIDATAALFRTPLLYPMPYSLVAPADSAEVAVYRPTFSWRATRDPDQGDPIAYTLWIQEVGHAGEILSLPVGADTVFTLPFPLVREVSYLWNVTAEDLQGLRRVSRETRLLRVLPDAQTVEAPQPPPAPLGLACAPNPFAGWVGFRVEGAALAPRWTVYDAQGRRVASGVAAPSGDGFAGAWDGRSPAGPGVYFLEVRVGPRCLRETLVRLAP
jgi:hypothetical protein